MKAIPVLLVVVCAACSQRDAQKEAAATASAQEGSVSKAAFGKTPEGEPVDVYTLTNANGIEVRAITFGGIIASIRIPDRTGKLGDVASSAATPTGSRRDGSPSTDEPTRSP
jgi:hypothetical protein